MGGGLLLIWLGVWMVLRRRDPEHYAVLPGRHRSEAFLPVKPAAESRYLKWRYGKAPALPAEEKQPEAEEHKEE